MANILQMQREIQTLKLAVRNLEANAKSLTEMVNVQSNLLKELVQHNVLLMQWRKEVDDCLERIES